MTLTNQERNEKLKSLLDKEFLDKLTEVGKLYASECDYSEMAAFILKLHEMIGLEIPYPEEYDISY